MKAEDIFLGPMLRRCDRGRITIVLASFVPLKLRFSVKLDGALEWLGHDDEPFSVKVSDSLHFYFGQVRPITSGTLFPVGQLLSYSIGVLNEWMVKEPAPDQSHSPPSQTRSEDGGGKLSGPAPPDEDDGKEHYPDSFWDYQQFAVIVDEDVLAYEDKELPTFFLQDWKQKLNIIHGSCRKPHDADPDHAGAYDAMALGDGLIKNFITDLNRRPAIGCWGGDQIYADDVHDETMNEVMRLAAKIEGTQREVLADSLSLPGIGERQDFVKEHAAFWSEAAKNHLITFAEYLAMYGLVWNDRNWSASYPALKAFRGTLLEVRRMLANLPSYMIFDDHDVTDDWNLSLTIQEETRKKPLGHQIVGNALIAFWLCQGYGNDPRSYIDDSGEDRARALGNGIEFRNVDMQTFRNLRRVFWDEFSKLNKWEFTTPTKPAIYFLDTRTQRGAVDDEKGKKELGAPAFLKSVESWKRTRQALQAVMAVQGERDTLLVLVAPAPILGFELIEWGQSLVGSWDPTILDMESWSANRQQFLYFMEILGGCNLVVLSGDVHYGFTSTGKFHQFDCPHVRGKEWVQETIGGGPSMTPAGAGTYKVILTTPMLQITSSGLMNYSNKLMPLAPALTEAPKESGPGMNKAFDKHMIVTESGRVLQGDLFFDDFFIYPTLRPEPNWKTLVAFDPIERLLTAAVLEFLPPIPLTRFDVKPHCMLEQEVGWPNNTNLLVKHNLGVTSFEGLEVSNYFLTDSGRESELRWDFRKLREGTGFKRSLK